MKSFGSATRSYPLIILISASLLVAHQGECFQLHQVQTSGGKQTIFHHQRTLSAIVTGFPTATTLANVRMRNDSNQQQITALTSTADNSESSTTTTSSNDATTLDTGAIVRYVSALIIQMSLVMTVLKGMDVTTTALNLTGKVPIGINFVFFYFLALKSRVFNPLCNARPRRDTKEVEAEDDKTIDSTSSDPSSPPSPRKMPTWTPPGIVFPIVWILIIGPLRALSSSLIYKANGGVYGDFNTIAWLMVHLSIGDVWNTINNIERRYGTSVLGVLCVWVSAAIAAYQYSHVSALAGRLLAIPLLWLTVATSLIFRTWQINPNPITGKVESWIPTTKVESDGTKAKTTTKMVWFE